MTAHWFYLLDEETGKNYGFVIRKAGSPQDRNELLSNLAQFIESNQLDTRFGLQTVYRMHGGLGVEATLENGPEDFPCLRGIYKNFFIAQGYDIV